MKKLYCLLLLAGLIGLRNDLHGMERAWVGITALVSGFRTAGQRARATAELFEGCREGDIVKVAALLAQNVDANAKNDFGVTPLHIAASRGFIDIVLLLINKGVAVDSTDVDGVTPLHLAGQGGHLEVVMLLVQTKKVDINAKCGDGWTPLHYAARVGADDVVQWLITMGALVNAENTRRETPLFMAAKAYPDRIGAAALLLSAGAATEVTTISNETPLHVAAFLNNTEMVALLLGNGANGSFKAGDKTARDTAIKEGNEDITRLLSCIKLR